ncbi:MAG: branched-chain amino acid aminotransferase [Zymomonas mobilis]|uniref:Branched-chain-amino-acid aminotransferase n=1 Tax=Zymomonas mobilis TaxID=542 RepID=A0A542W178_ZYMMB|nr:branched-chain amino acid aminotransferase [Zymomonas mobilis]TQL17327.1 branched chain amino acid aminotransferase [Zymomonas mobilis]
MSQTKTPFTITVEPTDHPTPADKRKEMMANPGFGTTFSDHMVIIHYSEEKGWHNGRVMARQPLPLDPAASVLHYAQEIFEGMKAYRSPKDEILLFRPEENARRFQHSAEVMAMQPLPEEIFLDAVHKLVDIDRDWVPNAEGGSLYIRPFQIASQPFLGVKPAKEYIFAVIACTVGSYFKDATKGVPIWVSENHVRAVPGGTGTAKCGGNYAASLTSQAEGYAHGCAQVVFLDAIERRWIEELGGMNVFFVMDDKTLVTPPLKGTILHGITRKSIIALAKDKGYTVLEQPYSLDQWRSDAQSGKLLEAFACGTAAVITSIGKVCDTHGDFEIGKEGANNPVANELRESLIDLQYGRAADPYDWVKRV